MPTPADSGSVVQRRAATILHVDMDAFYASVEALMHPELRGKPLIVGGDGARGVVASCSYEARFYGVRSAMPSMRAKRLCPNAVFVHGNFDLYEKYSRQMHEVFARYTPLVEALSLDEAFLDVAGGKKLFGTPVEIAWAIRTQIQRDLGLNASVGVATTKHLAKLASVGAKPKATRNGAANGLGVMAIETEEAAIAFLHSLPVRALWGVGPKAAERLERIGISTVKQIANTPPEQLAMAIGDAAAKHLSDLAWNRDEREVEPFRETKSVGHEQTYPKDLTDPADIHHQFVRLADAVSNRLRKSQTAGRTITAKVKFGNFQSITRSRTLKKATSNGSTLVKLADEMTAEVDMSQGVRLLGISVSNLEPAIVVEQLTMDSPGSVPEEDDVKLDQVIDQIRGRYGDAAVVPAPLLSSGRPGKPDMLRRSNRPWGPTASDEADEVAKLDRESD